MSQREEETKDAGVVTGSWTAPAASWSILVHGGAGDVASARAPLHIAGCELAAAAGAEILARGGSALDAAQRAVEVLEADPLFNAGTGACLDADGHLSLDASIMDGTSLRAGGVCALPAFAHPIAIARTLLEEGRHVLLAADGARRFATSRGFVEVDEGTMITPLARERWEAARANSAIEGWAGGTVGAVARDASGNVAAATSTGGMVNKAAGRVGDSPLIGAGTYADADAGACSTTGHGEAMIRICAAKTAVDAIRLASATAEASEGAARATLERLHAKTGQTGGLIVVAADGALGLARTTQTMSWAAKSSHGDASGI